MVATMGDILTQAIMELTKESRKTRSRIHGLFSQDGEIDRDSLRLALLKILGPEAYYLSPEKYYRAKQDLMAA
jgi:hypothetical protein